MTTIIAWILVIAVGLTLGPPVLKTVGQIFWYGNQKIEEIAPVTPTPVSVVVVPAPRPPNPAPAPAVGNVAGCVQPDALASQNGWQVLGWADQKYGGLRVSVSGSTQLPPKWEAIGGNFRIGQDDASRTISGVVSIYPPYSCRAQLGYAQ